MAGTPINRHGRILYVVRQRKFSNSVGIEVKRFFDYKRTGKNSLPSTGWAGRLPSTRRHCVGAGTALVVASTGTCRRQLPPLRIFSFLFQPPPFPNARQERPDPAYHGKKVDFFSGHLMRPAKKKLSPQKKTQLARSYPSQNVNCSPD